MRRAPARLVCALLLSWPAVASAQLLTRADLPPEVVRQIEELMAEKARRTPAQQKVSSGLLREQRFQRGAAIAAELSLRRTIQVADDGTVVVDITANVTPEVLARIGDVGVSGAQPEYRAIRARLRLDALETIAGSDDVQFIRPAAARTPMRGPDDVEGLKIFFAGMGGFDNHEGLPPKHTGLMADFDTAVSAFYATRGPDDADDRGNWRIFPNLRNFPAPRLGFL